MLTSDDRRLLSRYTSDMGSPIQVVEGACRQMRAWGLAGDWRYCLAEHNQLYAALQRLRARRDQRLNATGPP